MISYLQNTMLVLLIAGSVQAAQNALQQVTGSFGANPNGVGFYYYMPNKIVTPTSLIVAVHYCTGSAQAYFTGTQYANLADTHGYIVIYPNSPRAGSCFDVNTPQTLSHNGGGDSEGIASMVTYAISNWGVNSGRVFVTGSSSGAMMTNVLAGSYPNLFSAASIYSGVPFACFAGSSSWNSACAQGNIAKTAQQWGDLVRAAFPGYTGPRPRMMIWHGTVDTTLYYNNYEQEILEWTNVLSVSQTPTTTSQNNPQSSYTRTTYGCEVIGYSAAGVGHTVPVHETMDLAWFGITGPLNGIPLSGCGIIQATTTSQTTTTKAVTTTSVKATTTTNSTGTAAHYAQCGGLSYTGPTTCATPYICTYSNPYYSQCL